jgi:hypothetical protein
MEEERQEAARNVLGWGGIKQGASGSISPASIPDPLLLAKYLVFLIFFTETKHPVI